MADYNLEEKYCFLLYLGLDGRRNSGCLQVPALPTLPTFTTPDIYKWRKEMDASHLRDQLV